MTSPRLMPFYSHQEGMGDLFCVYHVIKHQGVPLNQKQHISGRNDCIQDVSSNGDERNLKKVLNYGYSSVSIRFQPEKLRY